MKLNRYQKLALRTAKFVSFRDDLTNAALGLCGESGEFAEQVKKCFYHGHALEYKEVIKELGDILWYLALAAHSLDVSLDDIAKANIAKLKLRYPEGFGIQESQSRVDQENLNEYPDN